MSARVSARRRHAVVVDDERLARRELRTLLEEAHAEQVHVVGEAASVADAARLVHATDAARRRRRRSPNASR